MSRRARLSQKTFGELFVTNKWRPTPGGAVEWLCRCSCGREKWVRSNNLRSSRVKSCGVDHEFPPNEESALAS